MTIETTTRLEERAALLREEMVRAEDEALDVALRAAERAGEELLRARELARVSACFAI